MDDMQMAIKTITAKLNEALAREKETEGTEDSVIWHLVAKDYKVAISAMNKQIPVDAEMKWGRTFICPPDCGGEEGDEYGWIPYCPTCGAKIDDLTTRCECGQSIKSEKQYPKTICDRRVKQK